MKVGVAGLGKMGYAIAERMLETDFKVTVWNRTPVRYENLDSVEVAESPANLANRTNVILSVMGDDNAIEAVYKGNSGFASTDLTGKVVIELCTTLPERVIEIENLINSVGGLFLECPVGGTVGPAKKGQLLGLAGGTKEAFFASEPVLRKLTRILVHLGSVGTGAAMKLSINLPLWSIGSRWGKPSFSRSMEELNQN